MEFRIAIFISGNGSNMLNIIEACKNNILESEVLVVVADNDKAGGINFAKQKRIDTFVIKKSSFETIEDFDNELLKLLNISGINLVCLAGYMSILSHNFLKKWKYKIINIHPSLLPKYKGLNTHKRVIQNNEVFSGCTVHYVDKDIDSGQIIDQKKVRILESDDKLTLQKKILKEEHKLYIKVLKQMEKNYEKK
tara:strand:+ start:4106 stop:4687 length:582 start_codon:yes stop_codon:yes gene_type:complete